MRAEGCTTTTKKGQTGLMNSGPPRSGEFDAGGHVLDILDFRKARNLREIQSTGLGAPGVP